MPSPPALRPQDGHPGIEAAQVAIARTAREGDAVTVATKEEARALNAAIREERVRRGEVDDAHTAWGSDGLPIGAGDVVQTRRNHSELSVANRQTWTVQHVTHDGEVWARATGAGLYVGMTRGRDSDTMHVVAADLDEAREQFTAAMQRDRADRGLTDATLAARAAVNGLVQAGPVAFVDAEKARLREWIRTTELEVTRWTHALGALAQQSAEHYAEGERAGHIVAAADRHLIAVRDAAAVPLLAWATADGADYLGAQDRMWRANQALKTVGRFGRRSANRVAHGPTRCTTRHRTRCANAGATSL